MWRAESSRTKRSPHWADLGEGKTNNQPGDMPDAQVHQFREYADSILQLEVRTKSLEYIALLRTMKQMFLGGMPATCATLNTGTHINNVHLEEEEHFT